MSKKGGRDIRDQIRDKKAFQKLSKRMITCSSNKYSLQNSILYSVEIIIMRLNVQNHNKNDKIIII